MALPKTEYNSATFKEIRRNRIKCSRQQNRHLGAGTSSDLELKDYSPEVFRCLQELNNIDPTEYMLAVCAYDILREVASPGRAGRVIPLSNDDRMLIRILKKSELKVIRNMLPKYYVHVKMHPNSILSKLYGLHSVMPDGGIKVYFAVISNTIPSDLNSFRIFDLKGSLKGRTVNEWRADDKIILKDYDFDFGFYIDPEIRENLMQQLKYDCEFLEDRGLMDYSLLLAMAIRPPKNDLVGSTDVSNNRNSSLPPSPLNLIHNPNCKDPTWSGYCSSENSPDNQSSCCDSISDHCSPEPETMQLNFADICQDSHKLGFKFGVNMPAHAVKTKKAQKENATAQRFREPDSYDVVLYFAIVDTFQEYGITKKIERAYKSLQYDPNAIAAINPKAYSSRFREFLGQIFQAEGSA